MPISMKNEAAIAGIGSTKFSKNSGVSELSLACEAISNCLHDAGLDPAMVDGLVTYTLDSSDEVEVARAVGMGDLTMFAKINYGGGAAVGLIQQAVMAVATGAANNVVVWRAMNNPNAAGYGSELTLDQYMNAKMISEPLRLYDCCQETDGGCALLITSTERARDLKQTPAVIRAVTQASTQGQEQMTSFYRDDLKSLPEMELAAKRVYEMSGLSPSDIDAACLYDAFTPEVIMQLESFGFCGRGEAKDFVADGNLRLDGRLPNNTHGGLLSEAYIHGVNNIAEGARLIRGTSTNQSKGVEHVLVSSGVGVPTGALIPGKD